MRTGLSRSTTLPALVGFGLMAMTLLGGCVVDHRGPGWYRYGHRWHRRPPPPGVVIEPR